MNENLQKNSPLKISGKRKRCNQGCTSSTAGDVIFEVGLFVVLPVQPVAVGGTASTQCFFCNKNLKGKDIFMYRYIFLYVILKLNLFL